MRTAIANHEPLPKGLRLKDLSIETGLHGGVCRAHVGGASSIISEERRGHPLQKQDMSRSVRRAPVPHSLHSCVRVFYAD